MFVTVTASRDRLPTYRPVRQKPSHACPPPGRRRQDPGMLHGSHAPRGKCRAAWSSQGQCPSASSGLPSAPGARGTSGSQEVPVGSRERVGPRGMGQGAQQPVGWACGGSGPSPPPACPGRSWVRPVAARRPPAPSSPTHVATVSAAWLLLCRGWGCIRVHRGNHRLDGVLAAQTDGVQAAQTGAWGRRWCLPLWALRALLPPPQPQQGPKQGRLRAMS